MYVICYLHLTAFSSRKTVENFSFENPFGAAPPSCQKLSQGTGKEIKAGPSLHFLEAIHSA